MQLSWFPKPIYKFNYIITFIALTLCGCYIWFTTYGWMLFWAIAFFSALILIGASFIVQSGVYVTVICKGNNKKNKIALTFDDGPCEQTVEILNILDKYHSKATFFLIGQKAKLHQDIVLRIAREQHNIGNHSYEHKTWFPLIGTNKIKKELADTQNIIAEITGSKPLYFRPPFGVTNPFIAKALKFFNFKIIGWSVRSLDTVKKNPEKILDRIKSKIGPGSIVLMHDTKTKAPYVLEQLLIYCKQSNLEAVSLDELLNEDN